MTRPEFELYETMANFNPAQETARKRFAINTMARSKEEAREEESLLLEIKRILARTERFNEERRELYRRLDYPHTDQDISSFKSSAGLQTLLQNLMNVDKSKKRKSLVGPDSASPGQPGSAAADSAGVHNRRESIAASASGHRDSLVGIATPVTPSEERAAAGANKKKGQQQLPERRKLTQQEEQVYGVSHHDRLGSGPTFRYEKINKLYSHKSGQQQMRITNALGELDIPARLAMPTAAVTVQFEVLWASVTGLVDLRKVADKVDAEIKLEEAKRAERQKAKGMGPPLDGAGSGADPGKVAVGEALGDKPTEVNTVSDTAKAEAQGQEQRVGDNPPESQPGPATHEECSSHERPVEVKQEEGDKEKSARPGSSGVHKRSASVLSTTSDKSAKRQKK
jgi:DNA methyltransferase 1-associated protein 1